MRKYYFTLAATLFSASVFAQTPFQKFVTEKLNSKTSSATEAKARRAQKSDLKLWGANLTSKMKAPAFRKAAGADTIITSQPQGTLYKNWYQYSEGYYIFWGYILAGANDGNTQDFVIADDGSVYLKNPIGNFATNSWIKGYKATGDTIAFDLPQKIYSETTQDDDGNDETINISAYRMLLTTVDDPEEGSYKTYIPDSNSQTVKFVLRNDSLFKAEPDVLLGMGETETGDWAGYGDWTNDIHKVTDVADAPANPDVTDKYLIKHVLSDSTIDYQVGKVAVEGNNIYLGGINPNMPNHWVKGRIEGKKAIFDKQAYLGVDTVTLAHTYFIPTGKETKVEIFDDEEYPYDSVYAVKEIVFDYDATAKTLKSTGGFVVNKGIKDINQQAEYFNPEIALWTEKPGVSEKPYIMDFMPYDEEYGYGGIQFVLSRLTDDGQYLNPEKLYYNLFIDDELFTFYPDEYPEFETETTDIPYYHNGEDVSNYDDMFIIYFYTTGFQKMGIREVYIDDDGKRYESETAWINADGTTEGIKDAKLNAVRSFRGVTYTDLSGRQVAHPTKGLYIKTATLADGTVKTTKVILK